MNSAIEVDNHPINDYSHFLGVAHVSFEGASEQVFSSSLKPQNGAGKMTTRRALNMLLEPPPGPHPNPRGHDLACAFTRLSNR